MEFNIILITEMRVGSLLFILILIFGKYTIEILGIFNLKEIEKLKVLQIAKVHKNIMQGCFYSRSLGQFPSMWIGP